MKPVLATASALALCGAFLYGCWGPAQHPPAAPGEAGEATLLVVPKIGSLGGDRQVLAAINPWTESTIATLEIALEDTTSSPATLVKKIQATGPALGGGTFDNKPITFDHLKYNGAYQIKRMAWASDATVISDPLPPYPINVGNQSVIGPITLAVQLKDRLFDGQATGAVDIIDGTVNNHASPEAIIF